MAWINEIYDTLYDENTICVACISHGKDSLGMLRAIKHLGLPLHRIVTTDVWATQDIPANLPSMWEWKKEADKIIKELYGIEVEHIFATKKCSQTVNVERERNNHTRICSTTCLTKETILETSKASLVNAKSGANISNTMEKLTYEDIFYRRFKEGRKEGNVYGFATVHNPYCRGELKTIRLPSATRELVSILPQANLTDFRSQSNKDNGVNNSNSFLLAPRMRGVK